MPKNNTIGRGEQRNHAAAALPDWLRAGDHTISAESIRKYIEEHPDLYPDLDASDIAVIMAAMILIF